MRTTAQRSYPATDPHMHSNQRRSRKRYLFAGSCPLFLIQSFDAANSPKADDQLVMIVAGLIACIGVALMLARTKKGRRLALLLLSATTAIVLAVVDTYYLN